MAGGWARCPLGALTAEGASGESPPRSLHVHTPGRLSALLVYLTLDLDGTPANLLSTGPESPNVAWEQVVRHLPVSLSVERGDVLSVTARHTDCYLQTLSLGGLTASMVEVVGEPALGRQLQTLVGSPAARGLSVALERPVAPTRDAARGAARAEALLDALMCGA